MRMHLIRGVLALVVALGLAAPAVAQSTGMVKGKVVDAKGQPVEGAKVLIEFAEGVNRKNETKTNKKGEFIQIGLFPGNYKVTASKEGVGAQMFEVRVRIGTAAEVNFQLSPQAGMSEEDKKKTAALQGALTAGEALIKEGKHDEAIAASAKAAEIAGAGGGGGSAAAIYNQGVSLWNAQKFAEAKAQFEKAVALDPNMADAWYQLGMANLNTGDMNGAVTAFEGYLKAAPNGPKAAEAKTIISQLKK